MPQTTVALRIAGACLTNWWLRSSRMFHHVIEPHALVRWRQLTPPGQPTAPGEDRIDELLRCAVEGNASDGENGNGVTCRWANVSAGCGPATHFFASSRPVVSGGLPGLIGFLGSNNWVQRLRPFLES